MGRRAHGEDSLFLRKDGRWVAAVSLGNGKRKYIYRRTKSEAVIALQLANQAKMQGTLTSTRDQTVEGFLLNWLEYQVQPRVREQTYLKYHRLVIKHIVPTLGDVKLQKLTPSHLHQFYRFKTSEGSSPQVLLQIHKLLCCACNDAVKLHHIAHNVCQMVDVPRVPKKPEAMQTFTIEQARQFLVAVRGDVLEALYVLALTTGMRQGELLALRWIDIDLEVGKLQVRRALSRVPKKGVIVSDTKSASGRRCIHLTALAIEALKRHRMRQEADGLTGGKIGEHQDWVFCNTQGKVLHAENVVQRSFHSLLEKAGLPLIRFHDLRHSTATLLLTLGVHPKIVQELLGHSQIFVTLDIYSHVLPTLQEDAMQQLNTLLITVESF